MTPIGLLRFTITGGATVCAEVTAIKRFVSLGEPGQSFTRIHYRDGTWEDSISLIEGLANAYTDILREHYESMARASAPKPIAIPSVVHHRRTTSEEE